MDIEPPAREDETNLVSVICRVRIVVGDGGGYTDRGSPVVDFLCGNEHRSRSVSDPVHERDGSAAHPANEIKFPARREYGICI